MKPKISVIGVGRLGLSFALLVNSKGYDVMGCDVNEKYIDSLKDKTFSSKEPRVNDYLASSTMKFTTDALEAFVFADIIFVFVPTPSLQDGGYNHKYIEQVVSKIEQHGVRGKHLIIGCTVMPRYCATLQNRLSQREINVIYNPEFIAQGSIIHGLMYADIVLLGGDVPSSIYDIYDDIMEVEPVFKKLTPTGAEIAKISINCFVTLKIAYANLIGEIITNSFETENRDNILETIGSDSRIGNKCLKYGFPAGGVCLPRDQRALNKHAYFAGIDTKFFHAIDTENERHSQYLVRYLTGENGDKSVPFVFSYLSYKQGVDILTDSYQLKVCLALLRMGYTVDVPISVKEMDTPEEFKDYVYFGKVTFGTNPGNGYKVN